MIYFYFQTRKSKALKIIYNLSLDSSKTYFHTESKWCDLHLYWKTESIISPSVLFYWKRSPSLTYIIPIYIFLKLSFIQICVIRETDYLFENVNVAFDAPSDRWPENISCRRHDTRKASPQYVFEHVC